MNPDTKAAHTPGPWRAEQSTTGVNYDPKGRVHEVRSSGGTWVAKVGPLGATVEGQAEANARLIAAAPDLLAACEAVVAREESGEWQRLREDACFGCGTDYADHDPDCPMQAARAAIKAAKP